MGKHQTQRSGPEHSSTKRRRNNLFESYVHAIAEQIATTGSHDHGSCESQNVWLMTVERLRKDVLNCRDLNRVYNQPLANAPPASSSFSSQCSLCKNNEAMAQTMCSQFLCWECLCKQEIKGPLKKACPCCDTIETKSHITFIDKKPELSHTMDAFPVGLTPFHKPVETISNPPASFEQQPTFPTSLIAQLDACSRALFLDHVSTDIQLNNLSCNAEDSSWLISADFEPVYSVSDHVLSDVEPVLSDAFSENIGAESRIEPVDIKCKQAEEVEQYSTCNYNTVASDSCEGEGILNVRDLDSILDENICDWSLLQRILFD